MGVAYLTKYSIRVRVAKVPYVVCNQSSNDNLL
jgi:hypothetical protein